MIVNRVLMRDERVFRRGKSLGFMDYRHEHPMLWKLNPLMREFERVWYQHADTYQAQRARRFRMRPDRWVRTGHSGHCWCNGVWHRRNGRRGRTSYYACDCDRMKILNAVLSSAPMPDSY